MYSLTAPEARETGQFVAGRHCGADHAEWSGPSPLPTFARTDMPMQVLGVLESPEIGEDATASGFGEHAVGHPADHGHEGSHRGVIEVRGDKGVDMALWDHDYVLRPYRARVTKRQRILIFGEALDRNGPAQNVFAVEILT